MSEAAAVLPLSNVILQNQSMRFPKTNAAWQRAKEYVRGDIQRTGSDFKSVGRGVKKCAPYAVLGSAFIGLGVLGYHLSDMHVTAMLREGGGFWGPWRQLVANGFCGAGGSYCVWKMVSISVAQDKDETGYEQPQTKWQKIRKIIGTGDQLHGGVGTIVWGGALMTVGLFAADFFWMASKLGQFAGSLNKIVPIAAYTIAYIATILNNDDAIGLTNPIFVFLKPKNARQDTVSDPQFEPPVTQ